MRENGSEELIVGFSHAAHRAMLSKRAQGKLTRCWRCNYECCNEGMVIGALVGGVRYRKKKGGMDTLIPQ